MDEAISKKKAIEELREWQNTYVWDSWCLKYEDDPKENIVSPVKVIEKLPSAQPEIVRCRDCVKREYCRTSTVWAVAPDDNWYCADAERRTDG